MTIGREGEPDDAALVVARDCAEARQVARALLGARRPDEDLRVLADLPRHHAHAVWVHVERRHVVVMPMEVQLLVRVLVVHDAERSGVVDELAVGVVEEVGAGASPAVPVHERQPQRVRRQRRHLVCLALVVGANVVRRRERKALEGPVLERVVEGVVVLEEVAAAAAARLRRQLEPLPLRALRAKLLTREQRRAVDVLVRVETLLHGQPALRQRLSERTAAHRSVEGRHIAPRAVQRRAERNRSSAWRRRPLHARAHWPRCPWARGPRAHRSAACACTTCGARRTVLAAGGDARTHR